ncbi:hypothetical protein SKAU_G00100880 [Synaphobranchus kaupii]|uniref:Uncharacterized protein n=1 Tax=Synaphobranchus kaupii TaxID=118154 RepID=A0A9Q1FZF2_SYNKA|nr:hypothetical protein SKAU_G00100880 [Synaphobranchus kaupii]
MTTVRRRQGSLPAALGAPPAKRGMGEELDHLERRAADLREAVSALEEGDDDSLSLHAPDDLEFGDSASVLHQRYERAIAAAPSSAGSVAPSNACSAPSEGPPLVTEATCALLAKVTVSLGLRWEEPASDKLVIPTYPQFTVAFREYWTRMQGRFRPSRDTRPWTLMAEQEPLGINGYPTMDDMVAAMILPDKEIIGKEEVTTSSTRQWTFGPGVDTILQQTAKLRKDRETLQQFMATSRPRPAPKQTWQPSAASSAVAPLPDADILRLRRVAPSSLPDWLATGLGRFSQAQRTNWEERVESPWVLDTVLRGYKLQFRCRPPPYRGIRVTTVSDRSKKEALQLEITSLLSKGAVRRLEPSEQLTTLDRVDMMGHQVLLNAYVRQLGIA